MADFEQATAVERSSDGRYRATLSRDWALWGPAGGYVSAIALRAAGAETEGLRPASYACQYLAFAKFEPVELIVTTLRRGRRSHALRVEMMQGPERILEAHVWASAGGEGLEHDYTHPPEIPSNPEALPTHAELTGHADHGFFRHFEQRPIRWVPEEAGKPTEPEIEGLYRFRPRACAEDFFADAARAVILADLFTWPTTYRAHPNPDAPSTWIAPNLDLYVRFHADTREHPWLYCHGRADIAAAGLIGARTRIFTPTGLLAAEGSTQLFCRPRPQRFT